MSKNTNKQTGFNKDMQDDSLFLIQEKSADVSRDRTAVNVEVSKLDEAGDSLCKSPGAESYQASPDTSVSVGVSGWKHRNLGSRIKLA